MSEIEKEYKWAAVSEQEFEHFLAALQHLLGKIPSAEILHINDSYLDNEVHHFSLQKVALRIRQTGGDFEATMKSRTQLVDGMACRRELTLPLQAHTREEALSELAEKKEWDGIKLGNLSVRFEIQNMRTLYRFQFKEANCEAALDQYLIAAAGKKIPCREIELELKAGTDKDFSELVEKLSAKSGLKAAQISKVATAEKLLLSNS